MSFQSGLGMSVELKGELDAVAAVRRVHGAFAHQTLAKALKKGGKVIEAEARRRVPTGGTHNLEKALTTLSTMDESGRPVARVGARRGKDGGAHIHLVEFGTAPRWTKGESAGRGGAMSYAYRGVMPAQPFLRPAIDAKGDEAVDVVRKELGIEIKAALR